MFTANPSQTCLLLIILGGLSNTVYAKQSPADEQFILTPYRDSFVLPVYYTQKPDQAYYAPLNPNNEDINKVNLQFQYSFKFGLLTNVFTDNDDLFISYTQLSDWQAYDKSAYFKDTQYQPELFWRFTHQQPLLGWHWQQSRIGFIHQSNGKGGLAERSWNRVFADVTFSKAALNIQVRPWLRIDGGAKHDYNPDIEDFLGYGDIKLNWQADSHTITLTLRNQFASNFSQGYEELTWKFPLYKKLHGYVKLESGYGMTISSYDNYDNAFGIGIAL